MTEKSKGGRPTIEIDWPKVDAMCQIQCTGEEIASVLGISYDTLERACKREKEKGCAEYIAEKKQGGKASLRRRQWQAAQEGNPTMLIWLGKQYLDQSDRPEGAADVDGDLAKAIKTLAEKLPG